MQGEEGEGEVGEEEEGGEEVGGGGRNQSQSVTRLRPVRQRQRETEVIEAVVDIFHLKLYHPIIEGKLTHVPPPPPPPVVLSCAPVNCANCQ